MSLENSKNGLSYGQQILLDIVNREYPVLAYPLEKAIVAAAFDDESKAGPVTITISEARLAQLIQVRDGGGIADLEAPGSNQAYVLSGGTSAMPPIAPLDWDARQIRVIVEWTRGGAKYGLECDPGARFTICASSVAIKARIDQNSQVRALSASIARGALGGELAAPTYTARAVNTIMVARGAATPYNVNRVPIPLFARTFRAASTAGDYAICVTPYSRSDAIPPLTPASAKRTSGRIFVASWDELHPIPPGSNHLYVNAAVDSSVVVQFQLGI